MPSTSKRFFTASSSISSLASAGAAQHMPHPAVTALGAGISLPGSPSSAQAPMAPAVVRKVTTHFSVLSRTVHASSAKVRTASAAASVSASVLAQPQEKRTAPCPSVPSAR